MDHAANAARNMASAMRRLAFSANGVDVFVMDSVSYALPSDAGHVIVTGSHGGASAGEYAARIRPLITVSNDAGIGKNHAGIRGMKDLDAVSCIALCVGHESARIGDGESQWEDGIVTFVNDTARAAGFTEGVRLASAVKTFLSERDKEAQ